MEAPCSCIGTPTIVGQEETSQIGSLLPVGLGPISDGRTPNTRIGITNSKISIRVIMACFWCSLPGWCSMLKELPNDTSANNCLIPASRTLLLLLKTLKKTIIVQNFFVCFILKNFRLYC